MKLDPLKQLEKIALGRKISAEDRLNASRTVFRQLIGHSQHVTSPNFSQISNADLGTMFHLTDELFCDGWLARAYEVVADKPLVFRLSTRMTRSGGTTTMYRTGRRKPEFEIAVATTPLFSTFPTDSSGEVASSYVGGVECHNRIEALQRIMEHEMIHLTEMLLWGDSNCSARPFKTIVRRLFGHTESNHRLLTPAEIAKQKLGIRTGDNVVFQRQGKLIEGTVNRITKRATVLVPDPNGTPYSDGKRYFTYYVPLSRLKKAS